MAASDAEICNLALQEVGAQRILSLNDTTVEGTLCKDFFVLTREEVLRAHPWKFAAKRASLAAVITPPAWGFAKAYQLPTDCLRVTKMEDDETYPWTVEGTLLLTDNPVAKIKYTRKVTAAAEMDSSFVAAFYLRLASKIAYPLTQSVTLKQQMESAYSAAMREARTFNAQEGAGDRVYSDSWLNARA